MTLNDIIKPRVKDFLGKKVAQAPMTFLIFPTFLQEEKFDVIIEIGAWTGTFSVFLSFCCSCLKNKFISIDYGSDMDEDSLRIIETLGGKFYNDDVYSEKIMKIIKQEFDEKRVLLLCDGGVKKKCFNTFSKYLKNNDVIMAHDYFETKECFKKQKNWKSCEIINEDIKQACDEHNLHKLNEDVFNSIFWTCRIKKGGK